MKYKRKLGSEGQEELPVRSPAEQQHDGKRDKKRSPKMVVDGMGYRNIQQHLHQHAPKDEKPKAT